MSVVVTDLTPIEAVIVTSCDEDTVKVVIGKVVEKPGDGTVAVARTVAADVLELDKFTMTPDGPARPFR